MVDNESRHLDLVFHALADPTRRALLKMLARREYTIGELADPFRISLAAVSKHIKVLEEAGLLTRERDGRIHRCTMNAAPLKQAQDVIGYYQQFWENRLQILDRYLSEAMAETAMEPKTKEKGEKNGNRRK